MRFSLNHLLVLIAFILAFFNGDGGSLGVGAQPIPQPFDTPLGPRPGAYFNCCHFMGWEMGHGWPLPIFWVSIVLWRNGHFLFQFSPFFRKWVWPHFMVRHAILWEMGAILWGMAGIETKFHGLWEMGSGFWEMATIEIGPRLIMVRMNCSMNVSWYKAWWVTLWRKTINFSFLIF